MYVSIPIPCAEGMVFAISNPDAKSVKLTLLGGLKHILLKASSIVARSHSHQRSALFHNSIT